MNKPQCSPFSFLLLQARPTLQGLLVLPRKGRGAEYANKFFPWQRVQNRGSSDFWLVTDDAGQPLACDGQMIRLHVRGWQSNRVARRAQLRHFQHAWDNGTLSVTADLSRDLPKTWEKAFLGLLAFLPPIYLIWQAWNAWGFWRPGWFLFMTPGYRLMAWGVATACGLVWVFLVVGFVLMLYWGFVMPNTAWIRISSDCAFAKLKDGTQVKAKWSQLKTLDTIFRSTRLKFTGHPLICLPQPRWSGIPRPALRVAREKSLGTPMPDDTDGISRRAIIRIGFYCLAASIVGAWLTQLVPPELRRVSGLEALALLLCSFGMIWGMLAALALLPPALAEKCARWQRRRRRAGLDASSSGR